MPNDDVTEKCSLEVARSEFERMCKGRRLRTEDPEWNEEERSTFEHIRDVICSAIREGRMEINSDDDPVLIPQGAAANVPQRITFAKAGGTTLLAMDGKIGGARQFAAYADMAGIDKSHFGKLKYWDIELLARMFSLFFQSR